MEEKISSGLERIGKNISILTVLTFIFGYAGFNTFLAIYHIPTQNNDISLIAGIGLINLFFLFLLYISSPQSRKPRLFSSVFLLLLFQLILADPIILGTTIATYLLIYYITDLLNFSKKEKYSFKKLRERYRKQYSWSLLFEVILMIGVMLYSYFIDEHYIGLLMDIYALVYLFHIFKRNQHKLSVMLVVVIFIFPVLSMQYFINSSELNILGLNKYDAEIITDKDTLKTKIIFNDNTSYYTISNDLKTVNIINRSEIREIKTKPYLKQEVKIIDEFKDLFKKISPF